MPRSWYGYFEPSVPRAAKGGIRSQSRRGSFAESWWGKRWIAALEAMNVGARLRRGRSYARRGQVLSIEISSGIVYARVQGSRPDPYSVEVKVKVLPAAAWKKLADVLATQAVFAAKLLAGEMPLDIETAFTDAKLSLFPQTLADLTTHCSCPDWSNPCKHIAAVYYLLGEEFDRDPFLIIKLRGMRREEFLELLAGDIPSSLASRRKGGKLEARQAGEQPRGVDPLPANVDSFWNGAGLPEDPFGEVRIPPMPGALFKRLGNFPFWRGQERLTDVVEPVYAQVAPAGLDLFLGQCRATATKSTGNPKF